MSDSDLQKGLRVGLTMTEAILFDEGNSKALKSYLFWIHTWVRSCLKFRSRNPMLELSMYLFLTLRSLGLSTDYLVISFLFETYRLMIRIYSNSSLS